MVDRKTCKVRYFLDFLLKMKKFTFFSNYSISEGYIYNTIIRICMRVVRACPVNWLKCII